MKRIQIVLFFVGISLLSIPSLLWAAESLNYSKMFEYSRLILTRKPARDFLKDTFKAELKSGPKAVAKEGGAELTEAQFMLLLEKNPQFWGELDQYLAQVIPPNQQKHWRAKFRKLIRTSKIAEAFVKYNNPLEPYLLGPSSEGYSNLKLYVNHERFKADGSVVPADNLKEVIRGFIKTAQKEVILNFFDFDLKDVAEDLVAAKLRGVEIAVGIDKNVIASRPEVATVRDRLVGAQVFVHEVDSVGLNHQKMIAKDWSLPAMGKVLLSSGNLTQSCIGPEGDLVGVTPRPDFSIPNANHLITLDSSILATLVHHELTKTLRMGLRGGEYPTGGAYQILGPKGVDGKQKFLVIGFTPGGALRSVNRNMIARVLRQSEGPVYMAQFAFSSEAVVQALFERAEREVKKTGRFEFLSVGDTPFSMQDWSGFLAISGLVLKKDCEPRRYEERAESGWRALLGESGLSELRQKIRIAPPEYGTRSFKVEGVAKEVTAKLHHKLLVSGGLAIMGSSFNFSAGAETNQEQLVVFADAELAEEGKGIVQALAKRSQRSVMEEAIRRNERNDIHVIDDPEVERPTQTIRTPASFVRGGVKGLDLPTGKYQCGKSMPLQLKKSNELRD